MNRKPLIYLACPYTDDNSEVIEQRVETMTAAVATFIRQNVIIPYSPILYTHPLVDWLEDDDVDWYAWDLQILDRCDGMIVVKLPGWETSKGVEIEINHCLENKIPYVFADLSESIIQCVTEIVGEIEKKRKVDNES